MYVKYTSSVVTACFPRSSTLIVLSIYIAHLYMRLAVVVRGVNYCINYQFISLLKII